MNETKPAKDSRFNPAPAGLADLLHDSAWKAPVTLALMAINLVVFAVTLFHGASLWHTGSAVQLAWGANFGPATQDGQWWRLLTAMFLHFGILHLGLNMWALWDVGRLVERLLGRPRFLLLFLASGVFGNLLSLVVQGNRAVSGGASGAVFSLYGALLVFLWRERRHVDRGEFRWLFGAASVFALFTLGMGLVVPGIDNAAHLGGLLCGAVLARVLARPWTAASPAAVSGRWWAGATLLVATTALIAMVPEPSYRMGEELRARSAIREFLSEDRRISERWAGILDSARRGETSFEQLAGTLDAEVTADYQESFEDLSSLSLDKAAPSAPTLEVLRRYAALRGDAAHALAEGLRSKDAAQVREALEQAQRAQALARGARPPASAASAATSPAEPSAPASAPRATREPAPAAGVSRNPAQAGGR